MINLLFIYQIELRKDIYIVLNVVFQLSISGTKFQVFSFSKMNNLFCVYHLCNDMPKLSVCLTLFIRFDVFVVFATSVDCIINVVAVIEYVVVAVIVFDTVVFVDTVNPTTSMPLSASVDVFALWVKWMFQLNATVNLL